MKQNTFTPVRYPIVRIMNFWKNKSSNEDKGGSFNLKLYLDFCEAQNQIVKK
jgi:hypothetical protein